MGRGGVGGSLRDWGRQFPEAQGWGKCAGAWNLLHCLPPWLRRHIQSHWAPAELSDGNAGYTQDGAGPHLHLSKDGKTQSPRRSSK